MGRERRKQETAFLNRHRNHLNTLLVITASSFLAGYFLGRSEFMLVLIHDTFGDVVLEDTNSISHSRFQPVNILGDLLKHTEKVEEMLLSEYGEHYGILFDKISLSKLFMTSQFSGEKLRRKMMVKILHNNYFQRNADSSSDQFIWATGGDSAAAAHGNLHRQSYTAIIQDTVQDAFHAAGISFVARNYAMGYLASAPELALCIESIYGSDIDILSWDFQLTDQDNELRAFHWANRAGLHPSHPFLFFLDSNSTSRFQNHISSINSVGLGFTLMDHDFLRTMLHRLPNSVADPNQMEDIPEALRYFMCDGNVEGVRACDDPLMRGVCEDQENGQPCTDYKYDLLGECPANRNFRSWAPGWKLHQLKGRLLGYFLLDQLCKAIIGLDEIKSRNPSAEISWDKVYDTLKEQEEEENEVFYNTKEYMRHYDQFKNTKDYLSPIDLRLLYRKQAVCHTPLLPSQIRFNGILTESGKKANYDLGDSENNVNPDGLLPLIHEPSSRCNYMEIDYKDYFLVRYTDDWLEATLPNQAELSAFTGTDYTPEGYIMICLKLCPTEACPRDTVNFRSIGKANSDISIRVSGKPVTGVKKVDSCFLLQGLDGYIWELGRTNFQHKLQFKVSENSRKSLRISSMIFF